MRWWEWRTILVNYLYFYHYYHITHDSQCHFQYIDLCLSEIFDSSSSCISSKDKFSCKLKQPQCSRYLLTQTYVFYFCDLFDGIDTYLYCSIASVKWRKVLTISQYLLLLPVISSIITVLDLFLYNRDLTQYLKEKILNRFHINRNLNK
jgi:hypothetical protein